MPAVTFLPDSLRLVVLDGGGEGGPAPSRKSPLRVVVLDSEPGFAEAVAAALAADARVDPVGTAATPDEGLALTAQAGPDVVLVGELRGVSQADYAKELRIASRAAVVGLVSTSADDAVEAHMAGIRGFLPRSLRAEEIASSFYEVASLAIALGDAAAD